ncbi:MAG TPA: ABC transporter ATP-binding protein [Candidatus Eisenbacteria bacterium]|nr:ABC transporter ATP-binding protein [Candidatus Eisenbacteria bacterium]
MKTYQRLLRYLRPHVWPRGVAAVACMLAFSALESSVPFVVRYVVGQVFFQRRGDVLALAVAVVLGVGLLRGALGFGASYLMDWVGQRIITDLRNELTRHMQRLDLAFFNKQRAGQLVSRVTADVTLVRNAVTDAVKSVFQDLTTLVGLCAVAIKMDWVLAVMGLLLFPVAALPIRYFSTQLRLTSRRQQQETGRLNAILHENIQGNRVVKAFGQEAFEAGRLQAQDERIFQLFMRSSRIRSLPITEVLAGFAIAAIIWYGGSSVIAGTRQPQDFLAFLITIVLLYEPFKKLVRTNYTIQQGLAGAERAFSLLDVQPEVVDRPGVREIDGVRDGIEFHGVEFSYEPGEPVLRDIDLRIAAGDLVALVGMSGGGKSTLADLIPRFYDVTKGRITIDGVDVRDVTLASLRRQMALVTQFTFLFNDTVRSNIAFGDLSRPLEEIVAAARAANAHDFISALPQGYETPIGDLGVRLSGGQRQRLAIARAILKNAPILILDEATSALDTESEGLVQEALDRLMESRTSLVVAHRLSTVRHADLIVVLSHGRIVERGTHEELLALGREYRKLYELQFGDTDGGNGRDVARAAGQ